LPHHPETDGQARWLAHRDPFTHIHATDVLASRTYTRLSDEFAAIVGSTLNGGTAGPTMAKAGSRYDAMILAMNRELSDRFTPLFTAKWRDEVARLLGIPLTSRVDGALHHIPRGSRSGWLHTDLCSGWFNAPPASLEPRELVFSDRSQCDYFTGAPRDPNAHPQEYARAASMIYYLNNDDWAPGDGGETELASTPRDGLGPRKVIAPKNNSLVVFECTPHSYHRLLANPRCPRNSIVTWYHTTAEFAQTRWGDAVSRTRAS
jgi:hypothetical protein